jgi:hypothetical protein
MHSENLTPLSRLAEVLLLLDVLPPSVDACDPQAVITPSSASASRGLTFLVIRFSLVS